MSIEDTLGRIAEQAAGSALEHVLRAALDLGGDALASILDRGTVGNDGAVAERVRGILAERSASRKAADQLSAPGD
jgi:hypothetical protein